MGTNVRMTFKMELMDKQLNFAWILTKRTTRNEQIIEYITNNDP